MNFLIRHITEFRYEPAVGESVMEVRLQPRSDMQQRCLLSTLEVTPRANVMVYRDFYGNTVHHFDIPGRHDSIKVLAEATVEMQPRRDIDSGKQSSWAELDELVSHGDYGKSRLPRKFARQTELLEDLRKEFILKRRDEPLGLLKELNTRMYQAFAYAPNTTQVDSPIDDALRTRQGVCQDFAHIMIAMVRELQIPCRYISGYLYHGEKDKDRSPAGATHAWVEAYLGEAGWVEFDPTNDLLGCERRICVAVGRDYADVPPTRGVHRGEAESELTVRVNVSSVDAPKPEDLAPAMVLRTKRPASNRDSNLDASQSQQQ